MSRHHHNRYNNYNQAGLNKPNFDKLFKVTTSPAKSDGTFSATFTGTLNYTGGGTVSGIWDFGDGTAMEYNGDDAFTHHGYKANRQYTVKLSITKSYHRNISQPNEKTDQYFMVKTLDIGEKGVQRNATFNQSSRVA
jgi:PKD repeat protein